MVSRKSLLLSLLVVFAAVRLFAAADDSLTGKWQVHNSIASNESDQACSFTQDGANLTGTCATDQGSVKIAGQVAGKKVNWSFKTEYNGSPLTLTYKGTVEGKEKISGTVTVEEFNVEGEFTATPAK